MSHHFFSVPALDPSAAQDELNAFCNQHRVVLVDQMPHPARTGRKPDVANRKAPGALVGRGQQPPARTPPGTPPC
jgi:hypothetical protein